MKFVKAQNASRLMFKTAMMLKSSGREVVFDNSMRADDVVMILNNPRARHTQIKNLNHNIFAAIANTFWAMAGANNKANPYPMFFRAPMTMKDLSGETLVNLTEYLNDNTSEKFAEIIRNFDPQAVRRGDSPMNADIMEYDGEFHMQFVLATVDVSTFDIFPYAFLYELLFNEYRKVFPEVKIGTVSIKALSAICPEGFNPTVSDTPQNENRILLIGPAGGKDAWPHFFNSLIAQFGSMITQDAPILESQRGQHWADIEEIFNQYAVGYGDLMYEYVTAMYYYILNIKGLHAPYRVTRRLEGDFLFAVTFTNHRHFNLLE